MSNDNFPNLWASFRAQVQAARGDHEKPSLYTAGEDSLTQRYGAIVDIWEPPLNETPVSTIFNVRKRDAGLMFQVHQSDLIAIAAQCMAVAEQMGELPVTFNASAHGHLIQRFPCCDEQRAA